MVLDYYNLRRQPFGVEPDPRFLLMSNTHREALASLTYGLHAERGFLALAAPPGMGKTTLLFHLLDWLRDRARTVFLFQTQCNPDDFFRYVVRDLGITPAPDLASIHDQLNQVLLEEARAGRRFVLFVDEAQDLKPETLETIRLLSNFETPTRKLLQIIIAGQLSLIETLVRQEMEQLRQRISVLASLRPFSKKEVADYIGHRLKVAGHQGRSLFTEEALRMIAENSEGIPRNINNICFNALSIGYALQKDQIGREVVEEVVADRNIESLLPKKRVSVSASLSAQFQRAAKRSVFGAALLVISVLSLVLVGRNWHPTTTSSVFRSAPAIYHGRSAVQPRDPRSGPMHERGKAETEQANEIRPALFLGRDVL